MSWLLVLGSIVGTIVYFNVYDRMTRAPLKVLWVDSVYARDLRNILDEFTDRTNISVHVESVPRELYREAVTRDLDKSEQQYDIVIAEAVWTRRDISRNFYEDITTLVRESWLFRTHSPAVDGDLFVAKSGVYYGMPVALDVFGVLIPQNAQQPQTLADLARGSLVDTQTSGELTHTFLALLLAQGGVFIDSDGNLSKTGLVSDVAKNTLEVMRTMRIPGTSPRIGRTEHLHKVATSTDIFAPLPGEGSSVYTTLYLAHKVKGSSNPRAADALLAWLGTKQAVQYLQEESGSTLVRSLHDPLLARSYSNTRRNNTVPVHFFETENAEEMLHLSDTYLAGYLSGSAKFTAQETLETIATAWEKELTIK